MTNRTGILTALAGGFLAAVALTGSAQAADSKQQPVPAATFSPVPYATRGFHLGVGMGLFLPESNDDFDSGFFFDIRYSFDLTDSLTLDTHLGFVSYETDSAISTPRQYDVSSVIPALTLRHHHEVGMIELYSRVGIGFMINNADLDTTKVDNGIVFPIGVGLSRQIVEDRFSVGLEFTHWITWVEIDGGPQLDTDIIAVTLTLDF